MPSLANRLASLTVDVRSNLRNDSLVFWQGVETRSDALLQETLQSGDDALANKAWFLDRTCTSYRMYVGSFEKMKAGQFYNAWCDLERVEIGLASLTHNPIMNVKSFRIPDLAALVTTWQSAFPYKVFLSPGMLYKKKQCSICQTILTPWSDCGHEKGRVYGGRECVTEIMEVEMLEISLVLDPVQKYSVCFAGPNGADHHDYSITRFIVERLASPFDRWTLNWTTALHPHDRFGGVSPEGACPCGCGRSYATCCLPTPGIRRPHAQIGFEKPPPSDLPNAAYAGYGERNGPAALIPHRAA
jgi:hypothetical protein